MGGPGGVVGYYSLGNFKASIYQSRYLSFSIVHTSFSSVSVSLHHVESIVHTTVPD